MKIKLLSGILTAVMLVSASVPLRAAVTTWNTSTTGTTFSTTTNWSDNASPTGKTLEFGATATNGLLYNDLSGATFQGMVIDSGASAYTISGSAFTLSTAAIVNNSSSTLTINNAITWSMPNSAANSAIYGTGAVTFNGAVNSTVSGGPTFLFNNSLTTFAGGFGMSTLSGARTNTFAGAGNVTINGLSNGASTAGDTFQWENTGTLTLSGTTSVFGPSIYFGAGTTVMSGTYASTAAQASTFTVGSGATPVVSATGVNTGNATLKISGNYGLGTVGVGTTTLTIKGGNTGGTPIGQGTLSLSDGTINTLTINNATASSTLLTMAGAAGQSSVLNMEIGNSTSDQIVLANTGKISVGAGGVTLNVSGIGGMGSGVTNLTLISAPGAGLTAGGSQFTVGTLSGNFGGYTTVSLANTTTTALVLTLGGYTATPGTAYWGGALGSSNAVWSLLAGGTANNSNWTSTSGGSDTRQVAGSTTNVNFIGTSGSNLNTSLGADITINSLKFNSTAASSVTIGGANTLTINAGTSGGHAAGDGITVDSSSGAHTISSSVSLGASQTWTNNSSNALTVSGNISGNSMSLTNAGTGGLVLGGNNTFTGGLIINDGTVKLNSAGALNSTGANSLSFADSAPSTAILQLNGNNATVKSLSSNSTSASIQNGNASTVAVLTVSGNANTTYAGLLQNGNTATLGLTKSGTGTLTLSGASNSYTGATTVNNGALLVTGSIASAVTVTASVSGTATIGGTGTIGGLVALSAAAGSGANIITGGTIGTSGTLTLNNGLAIGNGGIAYFDTGDKIVINSGGLSVSSNAIIEVASGLSAGTYQLIMGTGISDTSTPSGFTLNYQDGTSAPSATYKLSISGGVLDLVVSTTSNPIAAITLTAPVSGSRIMKNQTISVGGVAINQGVGTLNGIMGNGGGNLTVSGFSPSTVTLGGGSSQSYTASVNTGSTLGNNTIITTVTDSGNSTSASGTTSVTVLDNRVVTSSNAPVFGLLHVGSAVSSTTTLGSTGSDNNYTRVTVANGGDGVISVSGGTNPTFNGSTSDTRTISGTFGTTGTKTGAITLTTTGEGLTGESPINVNVGYTATIYSGKANWHNVGNSSWGTNANWYDTDSGNLGGAGTPGTAGSLSIGDTATFGDFSGAGSTLSVTLDGATPSLAALTFNATSTTYTIAPGTGGNITLQNAATPISVTGNNATISAVITGNGFSKLGSGTLVLQGSNTYTGSTIVANGVLQLTSGNNRLPTGTVLTTGSGVASGKVILGDGTTASNQTVAGLVSAGSGASNNIVGGGSANAVITVAPAASSIDTFSGNLGGGGSNENNLALVINGNASGTQVLSGNNTYTGSTTLTSGILNLGSANAIAGTSGITFGGGTLQWSAANTTDCSNLFTVGQTYNLDSGGQTVTIDTSANTTIYSNTGGKLSKSGGGTLILANTAGYALGTTTITGGVLQVSDMLTNSYISLNGAGAPYAVLQIVGGGTFARTLSATVSGSNLNWASNSGFSAKGGKLTVTLNGGAQLNWGSGNFVGTGTSPLFFGSPTADSQVEFTNSFSFNTADAFTRQIYVDKGTGGDSALLSGAIIQVTSTNAASTGFAKMGLGTLILSGSNSYQGGTIVSQGTLVAGTNSLSGVAGAFGLGTGPAVTPTAPSAIALGNGAGGGVVGNAGNPTLLIGGAFTVGRNITVGDDGTNNVYAIGGSTDSNSTFSGIITTLAGQTGASNNTFKITQVATTGANALNITGTIASAGATGIHTVDFDNVGTINVSGVMKDAAAGQQLAVLKTNSGTTTISSVATYTGTTTVTGGKLIVSGSLTGTIGVVVGASGNLLVNGGITTTANIAVSGKLGGTGVISGSATVTGGVIAPGTTGSPLTINGPVNLDSTSKFAFSLGATKTSYDSLKSGAITLATGATLQLLDPSIVGTSFASGDTVSLFANTSGGAPAFTGTFTNLLLPTLTSGLEWDASQLYSLGQLNVIAIPEPQTWVMLLGGFGMLLGAIRSRGRK